jgi:hypothetical protein
MIVFTSECDISTTGVAANFLIAIRVLLAERIRTEDQMTSGDDAGSSQEGLERWHDHWM